MDNDRETTRRDDTTDVRNAVIFTAAMWVEPLEKGYGGTAH